MSCMLEYLTVLHTFENLACVFKKLNKVTTESSVIFNQKICIKPLVYDYFDSYDYYLYITAINFNL